MAGDAYPNDRPNYFAHKFVRILTRTCAAMEIGTDGFCLLSIIVHTEDAAHYSGPVTFWNDQLISVTGLKTWNRLNRARSKAVDAGWLHYEPGGKGKVGRYWVTIPGQCEGLPDNSTAEDDPVILHASVDRTGEESGYPPRQCGQNQEGKRLSPTPVWTEAGEKRGRSGGEPVIILNLLLALSLTLSLRSARAQLMLMLMLLLMLTLLMPSGRWPTARWGGRRPWRSSRWPSGRSAQTNAATSTAKRLRNF